MDTVLLGLTAVSLGLAIAMGVVLFRISREERRRSDARVALLASTAHIPADPAGIGSRDAPAADRLASGLGGSTDLFATHESPARWGARGAAAAGLGVLILAAAFVAGSRDAPDTAGRSAASLELRALQHSQAAGSFNISGVVRSPPSAPILADITAAAVLFGPDGTPLATGGARLDARRLEPGTESAFVIKIPRAGIVSRYRVGFRSPDGAVIAHVDRRAGTPGTPGERATRSVPWVH